MNSCSRKGRKGRPRRAGGEKSDYSFDLEVFSEVSFLSCL
jgi:hypothetical protein